MQVICLCNPLLDIQATVEPAYLEKYALKSNDAVLVDSADDPLNRMAIYDELLAKDGVVLVAGGAGQNTARGAAYVLGEGQVGYFGCVGQDKYAQLLLKENEAAGVKSLYQVEPAYGTGKCAALITGHDRSLVTDLGAANHFKAEHIDAHWDAVKQAKLFYVGGFHLTVSSDAIVKLGEHAKAEGKPLVLNFSAPFIPQFFHDALKQVLPYATHVIANETEAQAFAEAFKLPVVDTTDLQAIAAEIIKEDPRKTVIFTHGLEPTVVATAEGTALHKVQPVDSSKIVDTNGAGDAFAAGFVAGTARGEPLDTCIDMGSWLAALSIQEVGPSYPKTKLTYSN
ncbi:adenosine kinase KNAG_0D01170 [Huiozyma naganishii CBS 8797]|uniref:Adenosine kinase n=1 Tax=Huiozyma naganishii (strain ATCC MYA-139 / BCRC 22969 / CBS 8797 / KCTC 17520 / NBRC 10181 / NCYC 3082 / Yp74L-3) TaxID=1071383 RepID=J7S5J0_HUIN7|nr:hypothetical protein KNAG_0D01170 [Kazachstania naganishii CBS 8797]CCK69869.1 hypothetical protein KNAG_0D01170 [Kazachstania naganishii CBS 8797]